MPWFSECGAGTASICIPGERVSDAHAQGPPIETLAGGGEAQRSVC